MQLNRAAAAWPVSVVLPASAVDGGYPPSSHDCMPLETVFALLQSPHSIGLHFLAPQPGAADCTTHRLHEMVLELWPQCAARLRLLIGKLPAVMEDIVSAVGGGSGR